MDPAHTPDTAIFVLGGYGYFGRLLVEDLLEHTGGRVCALGRDPRRLERLRRGLARHGARLSVRTADARDPASFGEIPRPGDVLVDCAGPFQERGLAVIEHCARRGAHALDIADAREFLLRVRERRSQWEESDGVVLSGLSTLPGLIVSMARRASRNLDRVDAIRTWMAPGNRMPRRLGTIRSLIHSLAAPFEVLRGGERVRVRPWSGPRGADFPAPVGRRVGYLLSGADSDVLPEYFPAVRDCEFRVSAELGILNRSAGWMRRAAALSPRLALAAAPLATALLGLLGFLGTEAGGMLVEVAGEFAGGRRTVALSITAERRAPAIAVIIASLAVEKILCGTMEPRRGWVPLDRWLPDDEFLAGYARRGCRIVETVSD